MRRSKRFGMFSGLWSPTVRFFAEEGDDGAGGAGGEAGDGASDSFDMSTVFDESGKFTEKWSEPFKDIIGDSRYFQTAFKPGRDGVKELVKHVKDLSSLKGRALLPKADADDAEWEKVFAAAGVPEKAEDYGLTLEDSQDAPFPEGFKEHLDKIGLLQRIQQEFAEAKLPMRLAGPIATARIMRALQGYKEFEAARKDAREKVVEPTLGRVKYDDAVKGGREALAKLMGHTPEKPNPIFEGLIETLEAARLADHPFVVGMLHQLAMRMSPGKILVGGSTPITARNPNSGPGVQGQPSFARAMMPNSFSQAVGS